MADEVTLTKAREEQEIEDTDEEIEEDEELGEDEEVEKRPVRRAPTGPPPRSSSGPPSRGPRRPDRGGRFRPRRKVCSFCVDKVTHIDYKNVDGLRRFVDGHGKIIPRRKTGTCAKHQRRLTLAIKRARHLALLPFAAGRSPYE